MGLDRSEGWLAHGSRCVHVVSRTAGQEILFGDRDKETFQKILFKQLKFSGLKVIAWCFMGNHFHLVLEVPERELAVTGLFIAIGHDPRSELIKDQVQTDEAGYVLVEGRTTQVLSGGTVLPGVFAAGDLVDHTYRQAITAAGTGCAAALDAERFLAVREHALSAAV